MKPLKAAILLLFSLYSLAAAKDATNGAGGNNASSLTGQLAKACDAGDLNQAKALIDQGAPIDAPSGKYSYTPLITSCGHLDVMQYLIGKGANLNGADFQGSTALLHTCWDNQTDCALALINAGADPSLGSKFGRTPLMYAAMNGNDSVVSALIAHHAGLNAACTEGPAIEWAADNNKFSTVKLLIDAGADLKFKAKNQKNSLLGMAARSGSLEIIDSLLSHGVDVDSASADGTTALMRAALWDQRDAVEELLGKGARIDPQNNLGQTALMIACATRKETAAMCLIDHGANVNLTDKKGETALTYAGNIGETKLVDLLKSKGATRTDVHIIMQEAPPAPLAPAQAWALAVGAIYTQRNCLSHQFLGGKTHYSDEAINMLRDSWDVHDRASFIKELTALTAHGHRESYQAEGAKLAAMSDGELQTVLAAHPDEAVRIQAMRASYLKWKEKTGLAWDLCRAAMLINSGYSAHYLKEQEAWSLLIPLARQVQGSFSSWQEMSDNFLDGREIWDNQRLVGMEGCSQLLLQDPNSPWVQLPWKTDLTAPAN